MNRIHKTIIQLLAVVLLPLAAVATPDYVLAPQDLIVLQVYRQPDLRTEQRVDSGGNISLPLIGKTQIAGLTPREAEARIAQAFVEGEFLRDPQVSLSIEEYAPRGVSVIGEVKSPGFVQFDIERGGMDIREVVAQSGGFTSVARRSSIKVIRRKGGTEQVIEVDFDDLMRDRGAHSFQVHDGDVIMIPARIF